MFVILVISLLLLSYVLTDFYLLSDKLEEKKKEDNLSPFKHSALFLLCSLTLTIAFFSFYLWFVIFVISILYFIFKKLKTVMSHEERYIRTFLVFVSEHLTHVIVIFAAYPFLKLIEPNEYMNILISKLLYFYPFLDKLNNINLLSYIALVIAGFLFSIRGGTRLSLIIINLPKENKGFMIEDNGISETISLGEQEAAAAIEKDNNKKETSKFSDEERMKRYGKMIGIIERFIIITAILLSQYQIIVIMTAIKSIGRFKEITEKTSDYYIIGNFASFSIAFFIGFILLEANRFLLG